MELSEKQAAFLDALFGEEAAGDVRKAMRIAGYADQTPQSVVLNALHEEIVERTRIQLAASAPKAALKAAKLLDEPAIMGAGTLLNTAAQVLDRVGIVKKDKVEVSGGLEVGLFILPPKENK